MSTNLNTHPENSEEDRDLAIALEWQRNMRKELEAENLAAERPPARNDNNYMAKRVVAQALGLPTKPNTTDNEQAEPSGDTQALEAESEPSKSDVADETSNVVRLPEQAREFGLLTRADVQGEPSAIPLIHGLISKGQQTSVATRIEPPRKAYPATPYPPPPARPYGTAGRRGGRGLGYRDSRRAKQ